MKSIKLTLLVIALTISSSAFAYSCPIDMRAIDKAISNASSLSAADLELVKTLRKKGQKLHKSGNHSGSVNALNKAKKLLGI